MEGSTPLLNAALLRWLNELSNQGIFTTDRDFVIRSWNAWLTRMTGCAPADAIGRSLFEVQPDLAVRGLDRYYRAALEGQASVLAQRFHDYVIRIPTPAGDMPQSGRVAPLLQDGAIVGTLTVIDDVSERVTSEAELRRQIAAAEEARAAAESALRAKDEFLATLSHELRTPLNAVLGWTSILQGATPEPAMLDRALTVIERNARAQARLIDDMLDMARIVTGKLRLDLGIVDVVATTVAAIDVIGPSAAAKRITVVRACDPGPKLIYADSSRLQQIIWNVLANAVKFTPAGGTVSVAVSERRGAVSIVVEDSGKGITADFLPYVFDRFRQANPSVNRAEGGLGLGLALVRQLVDMHGGDITVSSEGLGHGARFTITFPAIPPEQAEAVRARHTLEANALAAYRVLVVDDDADWREALTTYLTGRGAQVKSVDTTPTAIRALQSGSEQPNVAVIDIGLPHQDGYALLRELRALEGDLRRIPAVAVTAYASDEDRRRALAAGFDAFCGKPVAPQDVALAIIQAVSQSHDASRNVPAP